MYILNRKYWIHWFKGKRTLRCDYCKPNRVENRKRRCKHFSNSWKVKSKKYRQFTERE